MPWSHLNKALILFLFLWGLPAYAALSPGDSMEMRIRSAAERGAVADDLGSAFRASPGGEFLLMPPNKDLRFAVLIYNIDIMPDRAEFSAGLAFRDGRSNQLVAFKTDNVRFYFKQGLTGPVRMQLMSDVRVRLGRTATVSFMGGFNQTWAEFDCYGLKQFGISAEASINSQLLIPVDARNTPLPDSALTTRVQMQVKSWDELLVSVSLDPFQIKGFNGYVFQISKATLDLSQDRNAEGMQLPDNYRDPRFDETWEGFYLAEGKLLFPRQFSQDSISSSLSFKNLILDETGFSGNIAGERILSPEKGNVAGWRFGINRAHISFYRNCLSKAELEGPLGLPVLPDTQYLMYKALLTFGDQYSFRVSTQNKVSFPALKAGKVLLDPGSQVYVESIRGDFTARALLHGKLSISMTANAAEKLPAAGFSDITFQGLTISNKAPKFGIQFLGIGQNENPSQQVGRFPVSIYSISAGQQHNQTTVTFSLGLNLSDNLGCNTRFSIYTELKNENRTDRLSFVRIRLDDLAVRAQISNINFQGRISMMQSDPVYGDGFSGAIAFGVKMGNQQISGSCKAMFGNVQSTRYWYFDASVEVDGAGVPLAPAVNLNGFLGGAWNRMRALRPNEQPPVSMAGKSENGSIYVPDANSGLGLRAGVMLKSASPGTFEANAVLDIQFNQTGGINNISILGSADFFLKPIPLNQAAFVQKSRSLCLLPNMKSWVSQYVPKGRVAAALDMSLDFEKSTYQANMKMYVNMSSSVMGVYGGGVNGCAGQLTLFFTPTNWYVWLGNSQLPLAVVAKIPGVIQMNASAYFMAGTEVLPPPPLPERIRKAVGMSVDFARNNEMLSKGVGFALGAALSCQIGGGYEDKRLAIYASGTAETGFDILLQKYHGSVYCKQTGEAPGVNGWFAQGKYYVGASLDLGIKVGTFSARLANISLGAVLYGQGPNPIYAEGKAGISVSIAFISFKGNIGLQLGKKCDLSETRYNDIPIINIEEPAQGKDVSVLVQPRVSFALPVGKEFRDVDQRRLRLITDISLRRGSIRVKGTWKMADDGHQAEFQSAEPLQALTNHVVTVALYLETWNSKFSKWIRLNQSGSEILEQKTLSFNTGLPLSTIPLNNVTMSYPQMGQVNLHLDYSGRGHVTLKVPQWQSLLIPGTRIVARFAAQSGECRDALAEIKGNAVHFAIPRTLSNNKVYRIALLRRPASAPLVNLSSGFQESSVSAAPANMASLSTASKPAPTATDVTLISYLFRTSLYAKPAEKWGNCEAAGIAALPGELKVQLKQIGGEYWQTMELQQPNLQIEADISRNAWFRQSVYPILYGFYYRMPETIKAGVRWNRDTLGGLIPRQLDDIGQEGIDEVALMRAHFMDGRYVFEKTTLECTYAGYKVMESDLQALKQSMTTLSANMDAATLERLIVILPKIQPKDAVGQQAKPMQAPILSQRQSNILPLRQVSPPPNRRVALRNQWLMSISGLTLPNPPKGMVIPISGTYRAGSFPAANFKVGKGGSL